MDTKPITLELVEIEDPAVGKAVAADDDITLAPVTPEAGDLTIEIKPVDAAVPMTKGPPARIDVYAQHAAREYAQGHIDQPLWDRAVTQAHGDKTAAAAIYVRARGTALRLLDRDRRFDATRPLPVPTAEAPPVDRRRVARRAAFARYRYPALGALALLAVAVGSGYYLLRGDVPAPDTIDAAPVATAATPAPAVRAAPSIAPADPVAAPAGAAADADGAADGPGTLTALRSRIDALRAAGNWNVLVLHAVEWTRKEPGNAAAWDELRDGYVHLRQFDDALAAARKAVELAPGDAALWRHVGEVNVDLDDPPAALAAFREAVARDPGDVASLQAIGLLATRLGQPQEAKAALDRALAAQPADGVTQCLRAGLAQLAPAPDAYTALRQVSAVDSKCRGAAEGKVAVLK